MKTYSKYVITRPWVKYNVKYDFDKIMGNDMNYGNPLDSPIITNLIYSIDILSNRIRKSQDKYSKKRYIDVVFEMEGDLNYYLRCPRQRYLDDLLYMDREPNKWILLKNKFGYCISDLENLTRNDARVYLKLLEHLEEDFTVDYSIFEADEEKSIYNLIQMGYIITLEENQLLINPFLVQNENQYRYVTELLWKEHTTTEIQEKLEISRNLRVFGMERVPDLQEQTKDYITIESFIE